MLSSTQLQKLQSTRLFILMVRWFVAIKLIAVKVINTPSRDIFAFILTVLMSFISLMSLHAAAKDNLADVAVQNAWVRATVPGQQASGAFMTLTAKADLRLVGVSSPIAGVAEVHEMKMQGDIMQMRALASMALPAGKAVTMRPGGIHVMMLDLKAALPKDTAVPLTLVFKDAKGVKSQLLVTLPVRLTAP
jgi:periplasmic copper chaperone A